MSNVQFFKPDYDTRDYAIDYTAELDRIGETILSAFWTMASATVDGPGNDSIILNDGVTPTFGQNPAPAFSQGGTQVTPDAKKAICFIGGGTVGVTYTVQSSIITTGSPPRRYSRQFFITVRNR